MCYTFAAAEPGHGNRFLSGRWDEVSGSAKDFLRKLFDYKPHARPTETELLLHPFLRHAGMAVEPLK